MQMRATVSVAIADTVTLISPRPTQGHARSEELDAPLEWQAPDAYSAAFAAGGSDGRRMLPRLKIASTSAAV